MDVLFVETTSVCLLAAESDSHYQNLHLCWFCGRAIFDLTKGNTTVDYNCLIKGWWEGGSRENETICLCRPFPRSPFLLNPKFHSKRSGHLFPPPPFLHPSFSFSSSIYHLFNRCCSPSPFFFFTSNSASPQHHQHRPPTVTASLLSGALRMQFPWQPVDPC